MKQSTKRGERMHKTMTHSQFADHVKDMGGCTFMTVEAESSKNIPLNKTNKKTGKEKKTLLESGFDMANISKWTKSRYLFGKLNFEDLVNHRLTSEAKDKGKDKSQLSFKGEKRPWGERVSPTLVTHKGKFYLTAYPITRNSKVTPDVEYRNSGVAFDIDDSKFDEFRPPAKVEGANQGTKDAVLYRDFGFDSIIEVTLNKDTIRLIPNKD
jgi:hypothetical protein